MRQSNHALEQGNGALTREAQHGVRRINTQSATRRDARGPIGRVFTCALLGTLSPGPWDLALWARGRIRGEGDVV